MLTRMATALLLPPGNVIAFVLVGLLLRWSGRRRLAVVCWSAAVLLLWSLSTPWVAEQLVRGLERQHVPVPVEAAPSAEAIVVLGGGLGPPLPPRTAYDLGGASDRVLEAAKLFAAGKAPLIVVSGGYPDWLGAAGPESRSMSDLLVRWGVPREAILAEGASLDTHENAVRVAHALTPRGVERILLVTSALHMPRAAATFRREGFTVLPASTDVLSVDADEPFERLIMPSAEGLLQSAVALHERLGWVWYRLRGWVE